MFDGCVLVGGGSVGELMSELMGGGRSVELGKELTGRLGLFILGAALLAWLMWSVWTLSDPVSGCGQRLGPVTRVMSAPHPG